jgi:hypothetical protein
VVVSLFPDRLVACTRRGTCFPDRRVRDMVRSLGLVCGSWWWLGVAEGLRRWHVPCTCRLRRWPALFRWGQWMSFSVWICIFLSFHSVSLQWTDIIWAFKWLLAKPGLLSLIGLCFIVLRCQNVCSCNVSMLYLIAALNQVLSWLIEWRFFISSYCVGLRAELSPLGGGIAFCFTLVIVLTFGHL